MQTIVQEEDRPSTGKLPAIQFYPGDFLKDPCVLVLSFEAKAIWLFMILLMHESPKRGYLMNANKKPMTSKQMANALQTEEPRVIAALAEMEEAGTYSKTEDSIIYCRRMARQLAISEARSIAGSKGADSKWRGKGDDKTKAKVPSSEDEEEGVLENKQEILLKKTMAANADREPQNGGSTNGIGRLIDFPTTGSNALAPAASLNLRGVFDCIWNEYPAYGRTRYESTRGIFVSKFADSGGHEVELLADILSGLNTWKRSDLWKRGKVHGIRNWISESLWNEPPPPVFDTPSPQMAEHRQRVEVELPSL